ncbi:hypothetical protein PIB30_026523 [Stylosanthes scabra]|uniref:Filament-like plant protein 3 n=1 Tax=Stylosanthes scabra TaxID=79078 RepID=A0ABU6Z749_9FABA|nr:hypothetical protein [Stylosanthes scabra]
MDRRSWLWRRKSSEKSPGETESSGSISSLSERFSDDQVYATQAAQSPEITSKASPNEEEIGTPKKNREVVTDVKALNDKLAAALLNISAKEDLVKQHAKVAEEAVSGWEKAENEVVSLKQQLDTAKKKNSVLEDRVGHLDGALKECMRQLRQAREEQEQKILEAIASKSRDWDRKKSEMEGKIVELEALLRTAKADATTSIRSDLHQRLEAMEKENSSLKLELQSRLEELEYRIAERDLNAEAAEIASKQHLESVKKVAKLEAECRRLKAITHKSIPANDHRSLAASSVYAESFTDSMSDNGERLLAVDQLKNEKANGKSHMAPSTEIKLMDDFLEMEKLAALPDAESGRVASDQAQVEAIIQKNTELEKMLEKMEADQLEAQTSLTKSQMQLESSQSRIRESELKVTELRTQLALANKSNQESYEELKATKTKKEVAESKLIVAQTNVEELAAKICSLEEKIQKERALSMENSIKCRKLEEELSKTKHEAQLQQETVSLHRESVNRELKLKQEKELALAASRYADCQKTIASLGQQLKSLATLEDWLLDSENNNELSNQVTQAQQNGVEQVIISHEKSRHNNNLGKLVAPRSKSVSRRGRI